MGVPLRLWLLCGAAAALRWRPLTPQEVSEWYTPTELCLLNTSDTLLRPLISLREHCRYSHVPHCMVGMGHPSSICVGPFSARRSFFYGFDEFSSAKVNPAMRLIAALSSTNDSLFFIGDSVIQQQFQFFLCEVLREGGEVSTLPPLVKGHRLDFFSSLIMNSQTKETIQVHYTRLSRLGDIAIRESFWKTLDQYGRLLLVVNLGLHYHDKVLYQDAVTRFLTHLETYYASPGNRVVWLETSHQHFPNDAEQNGYYSAEEANRHKKDLAGLESDELSEADIFQRICPTFSNTSFEADWRNYIASMAVAELSHPQLSFFSTEHVLINVTDLYAVNMLSWYDCTHFCYSPLMWQPQWHYLADVAESMS